MAQDIVATGTIEAPVDGATEVRLRPQVPPPFFPEPPDDFGDGDHYGDGDEGHRSPLSNARLGLLMFLGAETMFFAGLIGTFLVFRLAHEVWPPATLPRLPVVVTGINTLILLYSAYTMWRANRAIRARAHRDAVNMLLATTILGGTFLVVQGFEWVRLISYGLTLSSGVYGATFYVIIGCHGLHVFGAAIWLGVVLFRTAQSHEPSVSRQRVALCGMYWYYVVALWPVLYAVVYLA